MSKTSVKFTAITGTLVILGMLLLGSTAFLEAANPEDKTAAGEEQIERSQDTDYPEITRIKIDGKYGYINDKDEDVVPCEIDGMAFDFAEGLAIIKDHDYWLCLNTEGKVAFPFCGLYPIEQRFQDGLLIVWDESHKAYGLIDREGERVVPCEYLKIIREGDLFFGMKDGVVQPLELKETNDPKPVKSGFYHWETENNNYIGYFDDKGNFTVLQYDLDMNLIETWQYWPKHTRTEKRNPTI